jgi:predicted CXXCH cytochrome family protein
MKSHVWRPLYLAIALVILILVAREFFVPKDFGIWERGYMYGFHNKDNETWWKNFKVKYKFDNEYCKECHSDKYESIMKTPHAIIKCENCHGPALNHPTDPPKLTVDKRRELCLRCHYYLPYPTSGRANIMGIDPAKHNPGIECVMCHNPHNPTLEGLK